MDKTNKEYLLALSKLYFAKTVKPRGLKVKEISPYLFKLDPNYKVITVKGFKTNIKYAQEELEWYYSKTNRIDYSPVIKKTWNKFSDNGETANSAYGYRMFTDKHPFIFNNQWQWCIDKLKKDPDSRQAVININLPSDKLGYLENGDTKDFVCTMYIQALIRNNRLNWVVNMRSNDIYYGMRNDIYCFMNMQERMSNELGVKLGDYYHFVGSLHIYEKHFDKLNNLFLKNEN